MNNLPIAFANGSTELVLKVQRDSSADLICKISGLTIAKIPGLPWGSIPHELPFATYKDKEIRKFYELACAAAATIETKHFCLFSLLAQLPTSFQYLGRRNNLYSRTDQTMQAIYVKGLPRLYQVWNIYSSLSEKGKIKFPKWAIGSFSEVEPIQDSRHTFWNFFTILSSWEDIASKFNLPSAQARGFKKGYEFVPEDKNSLEANDDENILLNVEESAYRKELEAQKNKIVNIFDKRSIDYKKLADTVKILSEFYKLDQRQHKEFLYLVHGSRDCSLERLERAKNFFLERGQLEEDAPEQHKTFLNWLRFNISAKRRIEQMLSVVQEEKENNPIYVKLRIAEENEQEKLKAAGMPQRENYPSYSQFFSAMMNWKAKQGTKS